MEAAEAQRPPKPLSWLNSRQRWELLKLMSPSRNEPKLVKCADDARWWDLPRRRPLPWRMHLVDRIAVSGCIVSPVVRLERIVAQHRTDAKGLS